MLRFQHVPPEQSFASHYLFDAAEDADGFLWFASLNEGFARYDGYEFKVYRRHPDGSGPIPTNSVFSLEYDRSEDALWVGTAEGLLRLDPRTDDVRHFRHDGSDDGSLIHDGVYATLKDRKGRLWVGTELGLARLDPGQAGFRRYPLRNEAIGRPRHSSSYWVLSLLQDSDGTVWVGTFGGGLFRYDPRRDDFDIFVHDPEDPTSLPDETGVVRAMLEDEEGRLWVGTDAGLALMTDRRAVRFEPRLEGRTTSIDEDPHGNLWISARDSLFLQRHGSQSFARYEYDPADASGLGPGLVNRVFADSADRVWVLTDQISHVPLTSLAFTVIPRDGVSFHEATLVIDRQGNGWVGSLDGLYRVDLEAEDWTLFQPFPDAQEPEANWMTGFGVSEDWQGRLWTATAEHLHRFDPATGTFESREVPVAPNGFLLTRDEEIWLRLPFRGLFHLDFESGEYTQYRHDPDDPTSISHNYGYLLMEDPSGDLWYGSHDGLNRFDRETGTAQRYYAQDDDPATLSNSSIRSGLVDSQGRVWFGTDFGLNQYDAGTDTFTRYLNGERPGDNVILDIAELPNGELWLGSSAGLARFDPGPGTFRNFSHVDGVPPGFDSYLVTTDAETLHSLAPAGIVRVDLGLLDDELPEPRLAWTGYTVVPDDAEPYSVPTPPPGLELSHRDSFVSFGFAALGVPDPSGMKYAYRLQGLHERWIESDAQRRTVTFSELPPADYVLEVRVPETGQWQAAGLQLPISVLPPPWRSWWAYALYALAAALLISAFIQWRTRLLRIRAGTLEAAVHDRTAKLEASEAKVRAQREDLERVLELKERLFANVSHEFRTPLTLMLGPIERAREATENPSVKAQLTMAHRNGRRVLRLVDQLLELSRLSSEQAPVRSPQPLAPVAETVVEAFRPLAQERGISLSLDADPAAWSEMPVDALERVLMNLLSNAVKFTDRGGAIQLHVEVDDGADRVLVRVADTGAGIPAEQQASIFERFNRGLEDGERVPGSGVGLALVRELVMAYGGHVRVFSQPGEGSEFVVSLPRYRPAEGLRSRRELPVSDALRLELASLEKPAPEEEEAGPDADLERPSVLVIDDNPDMRRYLAQLLSGRHRVDTAEDGPQGLALAERGIPDLVICDLMMPGMDGFEVARSLRDNERTSHIPIIMLTARGDEESRLQGLREQVDDYLVKPFNEEELALRVANLLAIRDILRARFGSALVAGEDPPRDVLNVPERRFLDKLHGVLETYHQDAGFSIGAMAAEMAMSERQLQRKLKAITDQTPALYLRLFRLRRALALLREGHRVGDVAFNVGFSSPAYFANCFRAQYGCTPSEFQQDQQAAR